MRISDLYVKDKTILSFEVYPPKDDDNFEKLNLLIDTLSSLKSYNPAFVSMTFGAFGKHFDTFETHYNMISKIKEHLDYTLMPHFTCVGTSLADVKKYFSGIKSLGVENILALRGDIPEGEDISNFEFKHAIDLVKLIKAEETFDIAVAGYPEGHIECDDYSLDMKYLKDKILAGADVVITQMAFDNSYLLKFRDEVASWNLNAKISAGIMPIKNYKQIFKMLSMARVTLPKKLQEDLERFKDNNDDIRKVGIEFAIKQCEELIANGFDGLHFYTLNNNSPVNQILDELEF